MSRYQINYKKDLEEAFSDPNISLRLDILNNYSKLIIPYFDFKSLFCNIRYNSKYKY